MSDLLSTYQGYMEKASIPMPKYDMSGIDFNEATTVTKN